MRRCKSAQLRLFFASLFLAPALFAQGTAGSLAGVVIDKATRTPIRLAQVINNADSKFVLTDSAGRFLISPLAAGAVRLIIRADGFPALTFDVTLQEGERLQPVINLDSTAAGKSEAQALPGVAVTTSASRGPRFADFERRQKTGRGQYLTRDDIEKGGATTLPGVLRMLRGVNFGCSGPTCYVTMARAPMGCKPEYVVDERVDNFFGPNTAVRDIEALEVYSGASDVPGEFAGRNAGCGVIVIWTKSGPPRKKP